MTDVLVERPRGTHAAAARAKPGRRRAAPAQVASGRRADIEGLRAVAVLGVLAFHAGLPWLPGGYVGVDVFFVISGYLITGLVTTELQETGRRLLRALLRPTGEAAASRRRARARGDCGRSAP